MLIKKIYNVFNVEIGIWFQVPRQNKFDIPTIVNIVCVLSYSTSMENFCIYPLTFSTHRHHRFANYQQPATPSAI